MHPNTISRHHAIMFGDFSQSEAASALSLLDFGYHSGCGFCGYFASYGFADPDMFDSQVRLLSENSRKPKPGRNNVS